MAIMGEQDRARCAAQLARDNTEPTAITKADLRAAVNATDDWIEANAVAFNSAIPQPARSSLTATQKTLLFCYVAMRRRGILHAEED